MTTLMKVEIIKRETIKPSFSTPHHLGNFKLSLLDQLSPIMYTPVILFYPSDGNGDHKVKSVERSHRLKKSLSETLTHFYPLAGRIKDNVSIDCNDDGVDYMEAQVNCRLSEILEPPETKILNTFLPIDIESTEAGMGRVLLVQTSFFECGGMTIGISISHKITDTTTLSTFLKCWAAMAHEPSKIVLPEFNAASIFPPSISIAMATFKFMMNKCSTRRFVFDASKITTLKTKAASARVQQPTRVEAVSVLIWKCAMAASRSNSGVCKPSIFSQFVNLRKRIVPPLQYNSFGSLVGFFVAETEERETELQDLVDHLRTRIVEFSDLCAKIVTKKEGLSMICEVVQEAVNMLTGDDVDFYFCSSWSRFPLYEADFGWGKPTWVSLASTTFQNVVVLIDTRDGEGVEAWVTLSEEDMALFERDQELLQFASINPSVLN